MPFTSANYQHRSNVIQTIALIAGVSSASLSVSTLADTTFGQYNNGASLTLNSIF